MSRTNFGYNVNTRFNVHRIEIDVELAGMLEDTHQRISTEVINLKEKAVREALIKLGWTPPPD